MDNSDSVLTHCCEFAYEDPMQAASQKSFDNLVLGTCTKNYARIALYAFAHDNSNFSEYTKCITFLKSSEITFEEAT